MASQCGRLRPNLNETKMRRRYDVACRVEKVITITTEYTKDILNSKSPCYEYIRLLRLNLLGFQ